MLNFLKRVARRLRRRRAVLMPEGEEGIRRLGHREYVGGMWDEIGRLQFDFLVGQGLKPSDYFLDIGCGSLRGGVHFVRYLEPGHYLGIDKEPKLIEAGIENELGKDAEAKQPHFVVSDCFEFSRLPHKPQFSLSQSLFTHLNAADICLCLRNLRQFVEPGHLSFATFFEAPSSRGPAESHSHAGFFYPPDEMADFGQRCGWKATYIGDWNHPRNQKMMKYLAV